MLQGHAGILASDKRRPMAAIILLVNVSLVVVAALWRHAAADEPAPATPGAAGQSSGAPQVELPAAENAELTARPSEPSAVLANDPVMEELRKVVRDPSSGLDIPRLDESSPLASKAPSSPSSPSSDQDARLQRRIETVHSLSAAALALVREARGLSDAGRTNESAALMQRAAELREMIASLAATSDDQP